MSLRDRVHALVNPLLDAADAERVVLEAQVAELLERTRLLRPQFGAWVQQATTDPFPAMTVQRIFDAGVETSFAGSKASAPRAGVSLVVYSHKPGLGATEGQLQSFYSTFRKDMAYALIVQHEPENNAYTTDQRQQWRDLQVRHAAVVKRLVAEGYKMTAWQCLMGWTLDPDNVNQVRDIARWFVPGIGLAVDVYPHADRQGNNLGAVREHARITHVPWAVAEYAVDVESYSTDLAGLERMRSDVAQVCDSTYPTKFMCYFNGDGIWGTGTKHYRLDTNIPIPRSEMLEEWRLLCQ